MQKLLDLRIRNAAHLSDQRIDELGPSANREAVNLIAAEELQAALKAARTQENLLYELIPADAVAPTTHSTKALFALKQQYGTAQLGDIPGIAKKLLTPNKKGFPWTRDHYTRAS